MKNNIAQLLFQKFQLLDACLLEKLEKSKFGPISKAQSMIFATLGQDDMTISDIAKKLGISRQAAQRTISELTNKKLLTLKSSTKNKSAKIVVLTPTGSECVRLAQKTYQELERNISQVIGPPKLSELRAALESDWKL